MSTRVKTTTIAADENHSWLGSAHGFTDTGHSIALKGSLFTSTWTDGVVPSGVVLGKVTASGLYGPYGGRTNEVQTITIDATGGTFTITFEGQTTAAIAWNATAAAVQSALELLGAVNQGDIVVTGGPGGTAAYVLTFKGQYLGQNVPQVTTGAGSLTGGAGTATPATTTQGGSAVSDGRETAAGILKTTTIVKDSSDGTVTDEPAVLLRHCVVIASKLPANNGLDDSARSDLKNIIFR